MKRKKHLRFRNALTALVLTIFMFSCQKKEPVFVKQDLFQKENNQTETILGKKLKNPYSVANMQKAYENLKQKTQLKSSVNITTTDYYVRFFPKTDDELQVLEADSLVLFDYPLDYEIEQIGDNYDDPEVNKEDGQWYYTSVPVDYKFPNVEYEILENLFLIDEEQDESSQKSSKDIQFLYELEDEALKITGNYTKPENEESTQLKRPSKRNPRGFVRVFDTERRALVGVEGVRVRTRRWFSYGYAWTSSTGYYRINRSYRRDVHYTVFFENSSGFKIRPTVVSLWKAKHHVGSHNRSGYTFNIYQNSRAWPFCTVNNAVVKYRRYCNQFNIGLPHSNLRIIASKKDGSSAAPMLKHAWGFIGFTSKSKIVSFLGKIAGIIIPATQVNTFFKFVLPDIIIKAKSSKGTASIYETTFHELAHASHFKKVGSSYWIKYINYIVTYGSYGKGTGNNAGLCALGESWGYHMGYRLVLEEFRNVGGTINNSRVTWNAFENFDPLETGSKDDDIRSFNPLTVYWNGWIPAGIMNDIVDNNRDFVRTGFWDNVSGYNNQDLFDALDKDVDTPQKFRDRLLSENGSRDKADLEELFEAYYWD